MSEIRDFEEFMKAYQNVVFSTAARLLGNDAEAQDIAQEVFLKAYERFAELGNSPTAGAWLKTVTRNMCINHLNRYRSRWKFFSDFFSDSEQEDDLNFEIPVGPTSALALESEDELQFLELALAQLPASQRVPLVLYHIDNLSYEEIAGQLDISLAKLKTDILRGREALRRKIKLDLHGNVVWKHVQDGRKTSPDSRGPGFTARLALVPESIY